MRILMVSGYGYWGDFDPRAAYREVEGVHTQIGGGETAMANIAHELAQRGHEVLVFYGNVSDDYDGVAYLRQEYATAFCNEFWHDALVAWDAMDLFRFYTRSKCRVGAFQLNDAKIGVYDHMVDLYMCPSKWHAARFQELYPEMTPSKFRPTTTNGVNPALYDFYPDNVPGERQQYKVIYSSSPDRGLHHLLRIWPRVKEAIPHAELHIYYDMQKWFDMIEHCIRYRLRPNTEERYHEIRRLLGQLHQDGIPPVLHGGVSKWELAEAQLSAHVMAYPCDPVQPTEGFSMSCLEGLTAGCYLLTSAADALPELWSHFGAATLLSLPIDDDTLTTQLVDLLRKEPLPGGISQDPNLAQYFWPNVAEQWEKEIEQCLT